MSEQELNNESEENLTGHVYDGIMEYDNPTPAWMTWVFIAFAAFTPIYLLFTLMSDGSLTPQGQYERAYVANLEKQFGELGTLEPDAATILKYMEDDKWRSFGKSVYNSKGCAACHGTDAKGNSAPNLADDAYLHVKSVEDIAKVIIEGANNGAMPAWGNRLHPNEVVLVSSYVAWLRGTATDGKGPEGEVPPAWSAGEPAEPDAEVQ